MQSVAGCAVDAADRSSAGDPPRGLRLSVPVMSGARLIRMDDAQASDAARLLARARWGTQTLDRAVDEVLQRRSELTDEQAAQLHEATEADND